MKEHLSGKGFILGVFANDKLVAFRNVYFPGKRDRTWNLGMDIGLRGSELDKVANLQMVCVHPNYRGNGLAMRMNRLSLELLRAQGAYEHVCATVSPYNYWNIRILLNSDFHIKQLKQKYGGKIRYIVYQQFNNPDIFDRTSTIHVSIEDFNTQRRLLEDGYCGLAVRLKSGPHWNYDHLKADQWEIGYKLPEQEAKMHICA